MQKMLGGVFEMRMDLLANDEVRELLRTFNHMAEELKGNRMDMEKKVTKRTEEFERMNRIMMNRESKMIELKRKIRELEKKIWKHA